MKKNTILLLLAALVLIGLIFGTIYKNKSKVQQPTQETYTKGNKLSLVFSHNINGETHPCGCRHFPLGGLPQVAGKFKEITDKNSLIYVDSGDTFFSSANIPESMKKSLTFTARSIAKALDKLDLKYITPGDQDFAMGMSFLEEIASTHKFEFLISNLKKKAKLKHKKFGLIERGDQKVFFLGLVWPEVLSSKERHLFEDPYTALEREITGLKELGFDNKNPKHELILLSHSGMENDKKIANKFPQINWIIGSHSQSFTKFPIVENKVNIVQVLSRNHYMGEISLFPNEKLEEAFQILEMRDELKDNLKPNPWISYIDEHKEKLKKIQEKEQGDFAFNVSTEFKLNTSASCLDCHEKQTDFWQETSHSIALNTLMTKNEELNPSCIECHSLGFQQKNGFNSFNEIVLIENEDDDRDEESDTKEKTEEEKNKIKAQYDSYWKEVKNAFGKIESVRKLSNSETSVHAKKWAAIDEKHNVSHNFGNVQCLNCHDQVTEHPFEGAKKTVTKEQRQINIQNKCLKCHTADQSPEWYAKDSNGLPGKVDQKVLSTHYKALSCPKHDVD